MICSGLFTAGDENALAVDVGCTLACQEGNDFPDLRGLAQTIHGVAGDHSLTNLIGYLAGHVGPGSTGSHAVDGDVLAAGFLSQGVGEADQSGLGSGVVALAGVAAGSGGAQVDDTAVVVVPHLGVYSVSPVEHTVEAGVDDLLPLLDGHLVEDGGAGNACVVHQDIDAAEALHNLGDSSLNALIVGNVALNGEGLGAQFFSGLAGSFVVVVHDGDAFDVLTDKDLCGGLADTAGGTGNDSNLIAQHSKSPVF